MTTIDEFPDVQYADETGLLALGGDLSPDRLICAYKKGIFPWYNSGEPILWWSPDPRCILIIDQYKPQRSLLKSIKKLQFRFTYDCEFETVIRRCAAPRGGMPETWITNDMMKAYINLHQLGYAHSIETWVGKELVGGLYGIALGCAFFGESMFSQVSNASKAGVSFLVANLATWGYHLIDCQITSPHLLSLGAVDISRTEFLKRLEFSLAHAPNRDSWESQFEKQNKTPIGLL